jgi:hypothetical protein
VSSHSLRNLGDSLWVSLFNNHIEQYRNLPIEPDRSKKAEQGCHEQRSCEYHLEPGSHGIHG